jgi:hypothetical protein
MGTQENMAAPAGNAHDDLAKITGIGRVGAKALNRVGVYRFRDLALCSSADLSQLLTEVGFRASPKTTAKWIEEANERSWETHAAFTVFFEYKDDKRGEREWQTRVYGEGERKYGAQKPFPGVEPGPWTEWMLDQAKLPAAAQPASAQIEAAAPSTPSARYDAWAEILDVQMSESKPAPEDQQKRLNAEVRFKVSGPGADQLTADRAPYWLELHIIDLENDASNLIVAEARELEPQVLEYTSTQSFPIPELGRYELHTVVLLLLPGEAIAHYQGPILRVVR